MGAPEERGLERLNESVAELLRRQDQTERRLLHLEKLLSEAPNTAVPQAQPTIKSASLAGAPPAAPFSESARSSLQAPDPDSKDRPIPTRPIPAQEEVQRSIYDDGPRHSRSAERSEHPHGTLETKVGLKVVNRVGVITLVLGVAFFFKWAADNNWIGPAGRVMLGVLASFVILFCR